ncbi:3-oxoacyl-[acyl-carrier-protein] reductase FabG [Colletotrichum tanaceti]|uniref:3-oxoacyl-[acyl-carrier-protein] reductase FabG n=1 Tax=Colletotrichum tanaceti TaxID=1306861 RepID=A0A4U6XBH8_9PEZI|nr:3-oxoacyl-[acyl-carrier-protein] reductase FabG [Colletotrichum tanaceti]TKW53060.1 3-oxoacyl-[acyl-carrier-protein] reductase FabG [Colletotrichum tanaceti]
MSPIPNALVTAGSAGLGAATAKLFARNGYNVVINYANDANRAEALVRELRSLSPLPVDQQRFGAVKADLSNRLETPRLVRQAVEMLKGTGLDVVFSNGGWTRLRDIADLDDNVDEDDWDRCFNMNVKSHLFLMHAARPYLDEAEGAFITTASLAGVKVSGSSLVRNPLTPPNLLERLGLAPSDELSPSHSQAYAVTKAAQLHLVKGLAIAAGPKDWGLQFPEEKQQAARDRAPLKRLATVEDVAEQVLCFARSRSVTGANAVIDGGLSI